MLGQCRITSHSDPREYTSLRFKLSTGNFIHEMYFKISSYGYGHAPTVLRRTNGPGNPDKTACWAPITTPKYLLSRVCTTINVNSSPHSAAYMRRWIGSALLQIMVCRLFGTKPLSEQTFRYSQELSPGPLVYRNKLQWNFNQNRKFLFTEMHLNISSVKWQPFCQGGILQRVGANWTRIKHAVWPSKCIFNTHVWINRYQFHWNVL